ncbi:MAG: hypothetical protein IPM66_14880 [Acidobacteriota bacterium]|nr:MAG: hypothetical protein IPM66_14880 [Acidobacteriota bacterium]
MGKIEQGCSNQKNKAREAGFNKYPGIQTTGLDKESVKKAIALRYVPE